MQRYIIIGISQNLKKSTDLSCFIWLEHFWDRSRTFPITCRIFVNLESSSGPSWSRNATLSYQTLQGLYGNHMIFFRKNTIDKCMEIRNGYQLSVDSNQVITLFSIWFYYGLRLAEFSIWFRFSFTTFSWKLPYSTLHITFRRFCANAVKIRKFLTDSKLLLNNCIYDSLHSSLLNKPFIQSVYTWRSVCHMLITMIK